MADNKLPTDPKELRALWRKEEKLKKQSERLAQQSQTPAAFDVTSAAQTEEAKADWERLKDIARIRFPAHLAEKFNLTEQHRLIAIAKNVGWTLEKIAYASGLSETTVGRILRNNLDIQEFLQAIEYHTANKDAKELLDKEAYAALQTIVDLRDDLTASASIRMDAAKWLWEQKYGKAKESKEIKGINLRDLATQVKQASEDSNVLDELLDDNNIPVRE